MGEGGFLVGDDVAFGIGEGVGGEGDEAGAGEGVEEGVEDFAIVAGGGVAQGAGGEFGVEFAGGAGLAVVESAEDGAELAVFFGVGWAEGLGGGGVAGRRSRSVPQGRRPSAVSPKWLDEGGHAALLGFGEGDHAVDLGAAEGDLCVVAARQVGAAGGGFGGADVAGDVDGGGALGDEFFDGLVEGLGVHLEALAEELGHLESSGEEERRRGRAR